MQFLKWNEKNNFIFLGPLIEFDLVATIIIWLLNL